VGPRQSVQKVAKVAKAKGNASGRTYTSKYRGVHQTFPTKRWEAQFRYGQHHAAPCGVGRDMHAAFITWSSPSVGPLPQAQWQANQPGLFRP
jgi:hypothetical protein